MHIQAVGGTATMPSQGCLSSEILEQLGLAPAPLLRSISIRAPITVMRLRSATVPRSPRVDLPHENGWEIRVHLRDVANHKLWIDGQLAPVTACKAGTVSFYDLTCQVAVGVVDPIDSVRFFLPKTALTELSEELGSGRELALRFQHGAADDDSVLSGLAASLLPAMEQPGFTTACSWSMSRWPSAPTLLLLMGGWGRRDRSARAGWPAGRSGAPRR